MRMPSATTTQTLIGRPADPRRVLCTLCEHTEFVHGDHDDRRCLYSECGCTGFMLSAVA